MQPKEQNKQTRQTRHRQLDAYATCTCCGEAEPAALRLVETDQTPCAWEWVCANCADIREGRHGRQTCVACGASAPAEEHHVGPRRAYPDFTIWLCLNCHAMISQQQLTWRRDANAGQHPVRYLVRGVLDVVRLFLERHPAAHAVRGILTMLAHAALLALGGVRYEVLADLGQPALWW